MHSFLHLNRSQVDYSRWDELVAASDNSLVYGNSWFLDAVCNDWSVIVNADYSIGIPLVNGKKFWQPYLYQPSFTQQFPVFSKKKLPSDISGNILNAISNNYRLIDVMWSNCVALLPDKYKLSPRNNQFLLTNKPYEEIYDCFHKGLRYALRFAEKKKLTFTNNLSIDSFQQFVKRSELYSRIFYYAKHHHNLMQLVAAGIKNGCGKLWGVFHPEGELICVAFTVEYNNRLYYIFQTGNKTGRSCCAAHFLTNNMIRYAAGQLNAIDFVGSDIPSIAFFNRQFGCMGDNYFRITAGSKSLLNCLSKSIWGQKIISFKQFSP